MMIGLAKNKERIAVERDILRVENNTSIILNYKAMLLFQVLCFLIFFVVRINERFDPICSITIFLYH